MRTSRFLDVENVDFVPGDTADVWLNHHCPVDEIEAAEAFYEDRTIPWMKVVCLLVARCCMP